MTTSDPGAVALASPDAVPAAVSARPTVGHGGEAVHPLARLDDAAIDQLAAGLLAALPQVPIQGGTPGAAIPVATAAVATIPGATAPGAAAAGLVPTLGGPPMTPDSIDSALSRPDRALPRSPGALPDASQLLARWDGGLPRLFDTAGPVPARFADGLPVSSVEDVPSYYFLPPVVAESPPRAESLLPRRTFDVRDIRADFPILQERVHGRQLIWLDNAATTQKPRAVIDRIAQYYEHENSNVHRGAHALAARATDAYEGARAKVQRFIGAASPSEIVFVRGTTEAVNLVAQSWGRRHVGEGDEIIVTTLEHHSNIVPWQLLAESVGAVLRVVPVNDRGEVLLDEYGRLFSPRTRVVAFTHVSNALGTVLPVHDMVQVAHRHGAVVLVDGAQAVSHFPVNVQDLDVDFYALSGHKLFGPTGIGVLYAKQALLEEMPPWQGGGNMIDRVTFERTTYAAPPAKFEAGTAALAPAVGLGAAIDYLERLGMANVARHEHELLQHATQALGCIPGVRLIGTAPEKVSVVSFVVENISAEDVGSLLDQEGIAVRAGHHCAQPTMDRFGVTSTVRPSLALYNTHEEVDALERALRNLIRQ